MTKTRFALIRAMAATMCLAPGCGGDNGNAARNGNGIGNDNGTQNDNGNSRLPPGPPVAGHPRLWLTADDLPRLRSWATEANPLYRDGLAAVAAAAKADMDAQHVPNEDQGGTGWDEFPSENFAELFAFMSLISSDAATQADYAARARALLMHVIGEAAKGGAEGQPFRDPAFATSDRARWHGEAFALTTDWIYPYLTDADKASIRQVFLRWADEDVHAGTTTDNHPEPIGVLNDPVLTEDPVRVRWALNNYYNSHMRNLGLMSLALDAADDPDGALRGYLDNATGAWLYVVDHALRTAAVGGQTPEGFEYSPQAVGYVAQFLLALRTAGQDHPELRGPQVVLADNPFWDELLTAYFHASSPVPAPHPEWGTVYQPAWYGDGQNYWSPDFIGAFGPLGCYDAATGNAARLATLRWIQTCMAPGGATALVERMHTENFLDAIFYFMLFDPQATLPADPRPGFPLTHRVAGVGHFFARTGWDADATWFTYCLGFISVDHQHGDGNLFEFYRRGEWLTKERTGYGDNIGSSDYHNTLALENDRPEHTGDFRDILWRRGSQWLYGGASGEGLVLAYCFGEDFFYATGDATALYNSDYESSTDITHASRSIVWLKPDHVVVYDRAASRTAGRFKRFWLNLPAAAVISGRRATMTTATGQQLFVNSLLPAGAVVTSEMAEPLLEEHEVAEQEPMQFRLRVEDPAGPTAVRFLHVLQGADAGADPDSVALVQSTEGTPFAGVQVRNTVVLFPVDVEAVFSELTYTVPVGATRHVVTGLTPNTGYDVSTQTAGDDLRITISQGGPFRADSGGVLLWESGA